MICDLLAYIFCYVKCEIFTKHLYLSIKFGSARDYHIIIYTLYIKDIDTVKLTQLIKPFNIPYVLNISIISYSILPQLLASF